MPASALHHLRLTLQRKPNQESRSKSFPYSARSTIVATHDLTQRRVGFKRRGIHAQRLAVQQSRTVQPFKHPGEHRLVRLQAQPSARSGNSGMIRRVLRQPVTEKRPQRDRVRAPPRNAALRTDVIHVPDQQHAEIHPRRNARTAPGRRLKCPARRLRACVESCSLKQSLQRSVKRVAQPANVARGNGQLLLWSFRSLSQAIDVLVRSHLTERAFYQPRISPGGLLPRARSLTSIETVHRHVIAINFSTISFRRNFQKSSK